jgi:MFS transporter, Spinster family, sphingosine-1-phosphate transporter
MSLIGQRDQSAADTSCSDAPSLGAGAQPSGPYVWYAILLLTFVNIFNYMDRMALSVLLPFIKADLRLSDAQLGSLVGFAFSLFYAVFGIPIARWADRGVRRNIIAIALATWSLMTALSGAAVNFWQLFLARIGVGIGEAGCLPPSQSIICDYVPLKRRPGVFAIHGFGTVCGIMVGMAQAAWLGGAIGWRWALVALGVPGFVLALIVRFSLREPIRGFYDGHSVRPSGGSSTAQGLRTLWRCRTYTLLILYLATNGFVQFGFNQWWPSFYARVHEMDPATAGVSLGIALGIGSGAGVLLGGYVSNRLMRVDIRLPLMVCSGAGLVALPTSLVSLFAPSLSVSMIFAAATAFWWSIPVGSVLAAVYSVTTPALRAVAGAITIFFTSVVGMGFGPACVGLLSDALMDSFGPQSLRYALLVPAALHPLLTVFVYAGSKTLRGDLQAVGVTLEGESRSGSGAGVNGRPATLVGGT